jgi:hypothetical protein
VFLEWVLGERSVVVENLIILHGNRFRQPMVHIYVAKWRREGEPKRRQRLSPQYQKAWLASFPEDLVSQTRAHN